jgi:hypothetical protein
MNRPSARWLARAWLVLTVLALSAACAGQPVATARGDDWKIVLTTGPRRPVALRPAALTLRVSDSAGAPVDITGLEVFAGMPDMEHGESRITFRRTAPGTYEAGHTFSMDGNWEIRLAGRRKGAPFEARLSLEVGR